MHINRDGTGERKMSIATKITTDSDKKTIVLENYGTQPVLLNQITRETRLESQPTDPPSAVPRSAVCLERRSCSQYYAAHAWRQVPQPDRLELGAALYHIFG